MNLSMIAGGGYNRVTSAGVYCILCKPVDGWTYVKVGTSEVIKKRLVELMTGCPFEFDTVLWKLIGSRRAAFAVETEIHRNFADFNTAREWFRFRIDDEDHKRAFHSGIRLGFSRVLDWPATKAVDWVRIDFARQVEERIELRRQKQKSKTKSSSRRKRQARPSIPDDVSKMIAEYQAMQAKAP